MPYLAMIRYINKLTLSSPNLHTAERFLYNLGDSKGIPSHIPNWHRVRAITKTTSLDRLRLVFSSTRRSYKPHAQPRVEPNSHNTLLCAKRFGSEIPGQVYDYRTSQEGAVPGQELDRWREGTLDGPSGKCTRNLPHW